MKNPIPVYRRILTDFQEGKISPDEFTRQYHEVFLADAGNYDDALWRIFNEAASAAEFYTDNPRLLASNPGLYLDEGKLRAVVNTVIGRLDDWSDNATS